MSERIAGVLVHFHWLLLAVAVAIACLSVPASRQLKLDWQVEGMFPPGDPLVAAYRRLQSRFEGNEIVLAVYHDPRLWDPSGEGLERLSEISQRLESVDGVSSVLSLAELHRILERLRAPLSLLNIGRDTRSPLLDQDDALAQAMAQVFEGYTHQPNSDYAVIACMLATSEGTALARDASSRDSTLARIREVMSNLPPPASSGLLTGEPVLVAEGFRMVERDGWRLSVTASVLVSLVLLICFRSLRWTLIPLVVVHWSLAATQAILVAMQLNLTMISSTLTAIVTVIGVATSIHILLQFQQLRRTGLDRQAAVQKTFAALLAPIMWACVTDAIGFLALTFAAVGPVRDFGFMMAVGSMMVLVAIILLVPGLALIGKWDTDPRTPQLDMLVRLWLRRLLEFCLARRKFALVIILLLAAWGVAGSSMMQVETDYTKNFARGSPIVEGYEVVERELGGAGIWDVMLPAPESIGADYLAQVRELEAELRQISVAGADGSLALTKVLSIADAEYASRASPWLAALPVVARLEGMRAAMPDFSRALLSADADDSGYHWFRIMLRSHEQANAEAKNELVRAVRAKVDAFTNSQSWLQLFSETPPASEVAGYHVMLGKLVASILSDQRKCFGIATLGILIVMTLATRSLKLGLLALIPNALPIALVLGTMGWLGLRINMGAAMIAAVSLGLSVDSSIHYLLHYRRNVIGGAKPMKALQSAQQNVGLAVVLSTVALVAGFLSLTASEFIPTVVFGTLASLTMLGGLLGNLVILPLLIAPRAAKSRV